MGHVRRAKLMSPGLRFVGNIAHRKTAQKAAIRNPANAQPVIRYLIHSLLRMRAPVWAPDAGIIRPSSLETNRSGGGWLAPEREDWPLHSCWRCATVCL